LIVHIPTLVGISLVTSAQEAEHLEKFFD